MIIGCKMIQFPDFVVIAQAVIHLKHAGNLLHIDVFVIIQRIPSACNVAGDSLLVAVLIEVNLLAHEQFLVIRKRRLCPVRVLSVLRAEHADNAYLRRVSGKVLIAVNGNHVADHHLRGKVYRLVYDNVNNSFRIGRIGINVTGNDLDMVLQIRQRSKLHLDAVGLFGFTLRNEICVRHI